MRTKQNEWIFLFACLFLGILANYSFLYGKIGISYLIFIAAFYAVLFIRFRFSFEHRRIGLLLMAGIWILAGNYLLFDSTVFYWLNLLVIPAVVLFHIVLITAPARINWSKFSFGKLVIGKLKDALQYAFDYVRYVGRVAVRSPVERNRVLRHIMLGAVLAIPFIWVVLPLLFNADGAFRALADRVFFIQSPADTLEIGFRILLIIAFALIFFCIFKVLGKRTKREIEVFHSRNRKNWNGIITSTILLLLTAVYSIFIAVQLPEAFTGSRLTETTYFNGDRGFFDLIIAAVFNLSLLLVFLKRVKADGRRLKRLIQLVYTLFIVVSGVLLLFSWQRAAVYQELYGYTTERLLAQSFIFFLFVMLAYTLFRVWLEHLPLLHFFLISGFVCYTILNVIHLEEMIVENNIARYEETGNIAIDYFGELGAAGTKGLIYLYENEEEIPGLEAMLKEKQQAVLQAEQSWQSYNFARKEAEAMLLELDLN